MNTLSIDQAPERLGTVEQRNAALREMTAEQLLNLGKRQIAYLKATAYDGDRALMLYAADGVPILLVEGIEHATDVAARLRLEFISVH